MLGKSSAWEPESDTHFHLPSQKQHLPEASLKAANPETTLKMALPPSVAIFLAHIPMGNRVELHPLPIGYMFNTVTDIIKRKRFKGLIVWRGGGRPEEPANEKMV